MDLRNYWFSVLAGLMLAICPTSGLAEDAEDNSPFSANLVVDEYYTDNVYYTRPLYGQQRLGDWVTVIKPELGYLYEFDRGRIALSGTAAIGRYAQYTTENYEDFDLAADGLYRFSPMTFANWGVSFGRSHEPRDSIEPSDQIGINPTIYWQASAYGAIAHRFDDNTLKLGFTYDGYNFRDSATTIPPYVIDQDDRDRNMFTTGARFTHDLGDSQRVFVDATLDVRDYLYTPDSNGYQRDSRGARAALGWQAGIGENGRAEIFGGILYQDYEDPAFATIHTPDFGASYEWRAGGTVIEARISRSLEETTLAGVSSYLNTISQLQFGQDLPGNMRLYGGASFSDRDFQGNGRNDQVTNFWLGARDYLTPNFYVGAEASFEETDSNQPVNDYTESRYMVRIGLEKDKAFDETAASADWSQAGFYVGAGADLTFLGTMLDGPREETNGSLTSDFGAFGPGGRLLGGWGAVLDRTYLGFELDASLSDAGWDHSRLPGGRVFSAYQTNTVGLSFLGGRMLSGGSLVYGRAGLRSAEFETNYATKNEASRFSDRYLGFEYGLGVRTPIAPSTALSLEYVHAQYPDYVAGAGSKAADNFANVSESVRTALTYHFGGIPGSDTTVQDPSTYSGSYWGLQGGLGALSSLTTGDRKDDSVLTADFGDHGYSGGVLAGYNFQRDRFIMGAEVDAAYNRVVWDHEREPSGNNFYLAKQGSIGIVARAGYVSEAGALLYAQVGAVSAQFRKNFSRNDSPISQTEWRGGIRYGGGVEVPVDDKSRMRFDYSFTDYGTLDHATPVGIETYDTTEGLFRIGYIRSF